MWQNGQSITQDWPYLILKPYYGRTYQGKSETLRKLAQEQFLFFFVLSTFHSNIVRFNTSKESFFPILLHCAIASFYSGEKTMTHVNCYNKTENWLEIYILDQNSRHNITQNNILHLISILLFMLRTYEYICKKLRDTLPSLHFYSASNSPILEIWDILTLIIFVPEYTHFKHWIPLRFCHVLSHRLQQ